MSVLSEELRAAQLGCRQQVEAGGESDDRTDDVTSKTRAGITRSHGSCPKCTPPHSGKGSLDLEKCQGSDIYK